MAKIIIALCTFIVCTAANPGLVAPFAYSSPVLSYSAPLTYAAAVPLAYQNAHLDAAYASDSVDIRQNYNAAILPATYAAVAPARFVAPAAYAAPVAPFATPLKYTAAAGPILL